MRRHFALVLLVALLGRGCASSPPKTPAEGGAPWIELTTSHFVLRTDLDRAEALELTNFLEQMYDALGQVAFASNTGTTRVLVVDFASESEFEAFMPLGLGGRMTPQLPNDLEPSPAVISFGRLEDVGAEQRTVFVHELTHYLLHASAFGTVPIWFNEGIAQYFSTALVDKDHVILGNAVILGALAPQWVIPSAEQIVRADRSAFYTGISFGGASGARMEQTVGYYAGAWWLVHLLRNGPDDVTKRFDRVVAECNQGKSFTNAWDEIMVPNGYADLNAKLRDYVQERTLDLARVPYHPHKNVAPAVRALSDRDIHLLWARLVDWKSEEGWRGLKELHAAADIDRNGAEVAYWWGIARLQKKDLAGALTLFENAVTSAPNDPRYWLALALTQSRLRKGHETDRESGIALAKTLTSLEAVAESPAQLAAVAAFHSARGDQPDAAALADRASKMDPSCVYCVDVRAEIAFNAHELDDAVRFQRRAIGLLPDGADATPFEKTLAKYEAARKDLANAAPPAPRPPLN